MLSGTLAGGNSTFGYDAFGRLESIVHPGSTGNFQQDLLNRITQVSWTGATPISQALGFDLAGNITQLERENSSASTIAYDAVNRILNSAGGSADVRSYTRDLLGNRLQDSVNGAGSFISNFLTSNGLATYTADANGFGEIVQEVKGGVTKNYIYRADGLVSGFQSGSTQVASYYDALGRLAARAINDGTNTYTQSYAYVEQESTLLLAKAGDGTITSFLSGQGPNEYLAESKNGVYKGYVIDHLGSILNSEMAGAAHRYSLHGEPTGSATLSSTSSPAMLGWQGLRYNPESGSWGNGAREYNPSLGSFMSQDPLGIHGGLNLYASRANNPLRYVDPEGMKEYPPGADIEEYNRWEASALYEQAYSGRADDDPAGDVLLGLAGSAGVSLVKAGAGALRGTVCRPPSLGNEVGGIGKNIGRMKGRAARNAEQAQIRDIARKYGLDQNDFRRYVEDLKKNSGRGGGENYTYKELVDIAEDLTNQIRFD